MFYLLLLLGLIAMATGVFGVGFAIPIRETAFGAALLMAGSVAVTGGFVLVGLAAAVRELQRVVRGLKARAPGVPRPVRPMERREGERREGERIDGADRRPEPRLPMPEVLDTEAPNVVPAEFNASDTQQQLHKPEPEWLRRAMAGVEAASRPPEATLAPDDDRIDEVRQQSDDLPSGVRPRVAAPPPDHAGTEVRQTTAASSQHMFDTVWPLEHGNPEEAPEPPTEPSSATETRPAELKSPPPAPDPPAAPPIVPLRPVRAEPRPVPILKSGVIDEMAYTLFTDGSIEAQMPDGTMRFASIEELRRHLEMHQG